jgi:modulator of FtsH protease
MPQLQIWQNFYMLLGGASATLVGLMFIAITLQSGRWTTEDRPILHASFNAFLSPTFIHFVYVLVTALVVLIPTLSETALGVLLVTAGLGSLGHIARNLPFLRERYRAGTIDRSDVVWYSMMPSIGYILYLDGGAGLLMAAGRGAAATPALNALAAASVLLVVIGVRNAWDLVVFLVLTRVDTAGGDRR